MATLVHGTGIHDAQQMATTPGKFPAMTSISRKLRDLYSRLRRHFGYHHPWWPGSPMEIGLTALLVQQCDWSAAWQAVRRLRQARLLSLPALAVAPVKQVQRCIHGVSFAPTKAGRLVRFGQALVERGFLDIEPFLDRPTASVRQELLSLQGIGEETADCLLLFAGTHPSFIIDAYTRRTFGRLGLFPRLGDAFWTHPYRRLKEFFETHILADLSLYDDFSFAPEIPRQVALLRDYHAQQVELGKHHCRKTSPLCRAQGKNGWRDYPICAAHCRVEECSACPLVKVCVTGRGTYTSPRPN